MKVRVLTKEEEDLLYGDRKIEINLTFKSDDHYYLQRENDVLHINDGIINNLHVGHLNDVKNLIPIKYTEFENKIKETIYELDIDKFWNKII